MSELRVLHVSEVHWGGVVSLLREFTPAQADGAWMFMSSPPSFGPLADGVDLP